MMLSRAYRCRNRTYLSHNIKMGGSLLSDVFKLEIFNRVFSLETEDEASPAFHEG